MVRARPAVDCVPSSRSVLRENGAWRSKAASAAPTMIIPTAAATISSRRVNPLAGLVRADIGGLGHRDRDERVGNQGIDLHLDQVRLHVEGHGPQVRGG